MNFESIKKYIKDAGLPNFRIGQVREAIFNKGISSWDEATSLPLPSANTQALSPQKAPFRALYWENPRATS